MNDTLKPILISQEVADLLQCSVRTVEDAARSGHLPAVKIGDPWLYPSDALVARLNELALEQSLARRGRKPPTPLAVFVGVPVKVPSGRRRQPFPDLSATSTVGGSA